MTNFRDFPTLYENWHDEMKYPCSGPTSIFLSNPSEADLYVSITSIDEVPGFPVINAHRFPPGRFQCFNLIGGEIIWLAGANAKAALTIRTWPEPDP